MEPSLLCIFHAPCSDGFTAAWVVNRFCNLHNIAVEFHGTDYKSAPPDCTDRHVLMVDFSYKMDTLANLHNVSRSLTVLDHHKTAMEDLSVLKPVPDLGTLIARWERSERQPEATALFDTNRSGAGITWDYFFPDTERPRLVNHVEDRDLWRFKLPGTREIQAAVFSYPYEFEVWDRLADQIESKDGCLDMVMQGVAIERKHMKDIRELIDLCTRPMLFNTPDGPTIVPVANIPYTMTSDAGTLLCEDHDLKGKPSPGEKMPFAVCYYDKPEGREFSFRSRDGGYDVGAIARMYGGGGHRNAAGCFVKHADLAQFEP